MTLKKLWHSIKELIAGYKIQEFPDKGYEIHSGPQFGHLVVTDEEKYAKHIATMLKGLRDAMDRELE